jgi:4-diphosphocytidyl-2-C-methyl-D-erythritol kinase
MPALIEEGRAKVNLTLRVVGRRPDGYHELESVVAFADCADRLSLTPGTKLNLRTTGPLAQACGETSDNLVYKAARLLGERVSELKLGDFILEKVLPVAAGIGGGSADAAAALRLLAQLNGLAVDDPRLVEAARLTGADVPVCVASRACLMTGIGETLLPLAIPKMPCVMVNPRVPVPTQGVFKALGLRNGDLLVGASDVFLNDRSWPDADQPIGKWIEAFAETGNDLQPPAISLQPVIAEVLSALGSAEGARLAQMSGSGATCFAIFENDIDARQAARRVQRDHPAWWVHAGTLS